MADKARVGMIGLKGYGNIVRKGLQACENLELAAIWSRSPESIERSQRELPSKVCETYEDLLKEDIDGVLIINPNYLHVEYGLAAAEAGKSILVEKPMTNTVAEGKQLLEAFRKNDVLLGVKHLQRFHPHNRALEKLVKNGELGEVLSLESYTSHSSSKAFPPDRWKRDPKLCPAAPLTQLAVHYIDSAMTFLGKPLWVQSHHANVLKLSENVDCTVTTIGYEKCVATFHAHYVVPSYSRTAVYGTEGVAVWDNTGISLKREGENEFGPVDTGDGDGLVDILDAYGDSLLTGAPFETDGDEALLVVACAEAAITSSAEDGRKVTLDEILA
ncbi:Gfo/Idh/MocA family protein [Planctomycetota bacterium]